MKKFILAITLVLGIQVSVSACNYASYAPVVTYVPQVQFVVPTVAIPITTVQAAVPTVSVAASTPVVAAPVITTVASPAYTSVITAPVFNVVARNYGYNGFYGASFNNFATNHVRTRAFVSTPVVRVRAITPVRSRTVTRTVTRTRG